MGGVVVSLLSALAAAWLYQVLSLGDTASVCYWQIAVLALVGGAAVHDGGSDGLADKKAMPG